MNLNPLDPNYIPPIPTYWQLEYPTGLLRTEPQGGETILHAPKGYLALILIDGTNGQPVQRVEIPPKCRPIFYRVMGKNADPKNPNHRTDAVVFGYGQDPEYMGDNEQATNNMVWLWDWSAKRASPVPKRYMMLGAISHQLTSPIGT